VDELMTRRADLGVVAEAQRKLQVIVRGS
jgi:hypothetical protein